MKCELVGIQTGTSKKGNAYRILHLMQPFDKPEYGTGCRVSQEFVNDSLDLTGIQPGMKVELSYSKGYDGRAYISDIKQVK